VQKRKLRFGMVGGGAGAFIGPVHRMAAELDGHAELVCGAFASDPKRSQSSGQDIYRLPAQRCYPSYEVMFKQEQALPADERMDFVVIVTPNHLHVPVAQAALQAGFHVVCDKPLAMHVDEALQLAELVQASELRFALTHNYTGYPMIREARDLVASGALGTIRRVSCSYLQGWLAEEAADSKQAQWRTNPARAGSAGCFGDIGSHAENLLSFVSGLAIEAVCADLSTFVPGRALDDDGNVLLRLSNGARGTISASQIAVGKENDLTLQLYGEKGGLEWRQSNANSLIVRWPDKPYEVRRSGWPGTGVNSQAATRIPAGHPEGYIEAFAQIYRDFCLHLHGLPHDEYPSIEAGLRGNRFIQAVVQSSAQDCAWVKLDVN
jgi:predicted dehydrogenase